MPSNTVKLNPEKSPKDKRQHGLGITLFSGGILVVIIVTFIGAPIVSKAGTSDAFVFGSYDGVPVEYVQGNYYAQQVEYLSRLYEQFNFGSDVNQTRQLVWRQAFQQTALQVGLKKEAERAGIVVTDKFLDSQLVKHSAYQQDGAFSEELWRNTSAADRFRYRQETQAELLTQQFAGDYTSGTLLSGSTSKFVTSLAFPQRKFSYISFVDADFPLDQVKDYAQKNKALFRTINLSRITVTASEAEAKKAHDEAVKGVKTFEELAKTYSKDPLAETGGALNSRAYYELKSEITKIENLDKVYGLAKGGVSDVFSNGSNWTFYKVVEASRDADLTATATLDLARSYLEKNDRGLVEDYLESKAKEFQVAATSNFDAAAKALGKSVQKTEWVSLNFGNDDLFNSLSSATKDSVIQGQSANEDFFKKAFRTADKGVTAPILTGTVVLVMRVDEVKTEAATGDTAVTEASVRSKAVSDRQSSLQQLILTSPKFKDEFQTEYNRLYTQ